MLDSLFEKMKPEHTEDDNIFTDAGKIMADKAVEIVWQIIETGRIEQ